jgi:iron complex outermembrane receptor protein
MKTRISFIILFLFISLVSLAQGIDKDTIKLKEVVVTSNRMPFALKANPGAVSLVLPDVLSLMPKGAGVEEALRLVPGVRIDNQHDGEKIHLSIRGQGILTERGLRGIGVLIDGIPVNDPSGFAPDLYDVDWLTVNRVEVLRGPAAAMYGGSGAGGVLNISTENGVSHPVGGTINQIAGSNGYYKTLAQLSGSKGNMDYRVSYSRTGGSGYRDHQGFWGNKFYEKINIRPSEKTLLTQIVSYTEYFQQNPEGLNLGQFSDLRQANPDACPFNEYQKTRRLTAGLNFKYRFSDLHDLQIMGFIRQWNYKETSNRCAEYRNVLNPGGSVQYNLHLGKGKVKNNISIGGDFKWQDIAMYKLQSYSNPLREESLDPTNLENDSLLANQLIKQYSLGGFLLYNLNIGKFNFMASVRYDDMKNELTDKMLGPDTASTSKNFSRTSIRAGVSYSFMDALTLFAGWSQGFMPPSTEELASNPTGYHGFNTHLVPATSQCTELGLRGFVGEGLNYEVTGFLMQTKNDFFRFKQSGRGNQEVFYGNAGNSQRIGIELSASYSFLKHLTVALAYTFADYKYTSASIDPVYTDTAYVLTNPPASGQWLPNSPKHQLFGEIVYKINKNFKLSVGAEYQSKWAIYTDANVYNGNADPTIYQNWQDGFTLLQGRFAYEWNLWKLKGELSIFGRNLTGAKYMAFTEPDPDGNAYQPGPGMELFGGLKVRF